MINDPRLFALTLRIVSI